MRFRKLLLYVMVFVTGFTVPLHATMLIIIYTPDGYWIGADSSRSKGSERLDTVCKVHQTKWGILLKAGTETAISFDGHEYSTDREVQTILATSRSVDDFKMQVESKFHSDIDAELAYDLLKVYEQFPSEYPLGGPTPENVESLVFNVPPIPDSLVDSLNTEVILMDSGQAPRTGEILEVAPMSQPISNPTQFKTQYHLVADSYLDWTQISSLPSFTTRSNHVFTFPPSIRMFGYVVTYDKRDAWVQQHPKDALLELLAMGHHDLPSDIGEPYAIVHVVRQEGKPNDVQWVSKGACKPEGKNSPW